MIASHLKRLTLFTLQLVLHCGAVSLFRECLFPKGDLCIKAEVIMLNQPLVFQN